MRTIRFVPDAWEAYLYWQDQDKKTLKRLNLLITATARDPFAQSRFAANYPATGQDKFVLRNFCIKSKRVGWARFCAHADAKPRGQTINLSAHPTLFSENKFTLARRWINR